MGASGPQTTPASVQAVRDFAPASAAPGVRLAGSDAPEKDVVRIGYMPLADCAPIVMAAELGLDRRHGIRIVPQREASWAGVRDKLLAGELDAAQALYGLAYGVHLGLGGTQCDMAVLMTLNQNGQGLTLSRRLAERGAVDAASLAALLAREGRTHRFAHTFPTGTHAMWLYHWLASAGIHPLSDVQTIAVPPPQMVAYLREDRIDGCSVGEPWNQLAVHEGVGITAATSQQVWPDHPEKVLAATASFADTHPNTVRAVLMALLDASRWIDASDEHRTQAARTIAGAAYLDMPESIVLPRFLGDYADAAGRVHRAPHRLRFHADGAVNFPYLSDGMWFLTQYRRWGLLAGHPDYLGVATRINRIAAYREAAATLGVPLPGDAMRSSRLIDGVVWDGSDPAGYADRFELRAPARDDLPCLAA